MIEFTAGKYCISINDEPDFDMYSSDNKIYDNVLVLTKKTDYSRTISLEVEKGGMIKTAAFVIPYYTPRDDFYITLDDEHILFMFDNYICIFELSSIRIINSKLIEHSGTMFAIYPYKDEFIIYGEMEIFKINKELSVIWSFGGRDIFVTCNSDINPFTMKADRICLYDFSENYYEINYNGKLLTDMPNTNMESKK